MYNTSLNNNIVPHTWKLANIIPIPKPNKDMNIGTSYRPISLISVIVKTLEDITPIHHQLYRKHYTIGRAGYRDLLCRTRAERSNISKITDEPASSAHKMSFWTLIKAVSVECLSLYAACSGSNILFLIKCSLSLPDTIFSMIFEINVQLDTWR